MVRPKKESTNISSLLFSFFWWISHKISPRFSKRLIVMGIRDGAFSAKHFFHKTLGQNLFGFYFKNPIGVAAGLDKRGNVIDGLIHMGYSFGEFGSYTLEKELPLKEVHYLRNDKAILVQTLGFRNPGLNAIVPTLISRRHLPHFAGISIVSSAPTEDENIKFGQHMTYEHEFGLMAAKIAPYCDYIALNFSHTDTELSRMISDKSTLIPIIKSVQNAIEQSAPLTRPKIFVKLPLDLTKMETALVCDHLMSVHIDGVIVGGMQSLSKTTTTGLSDTKITKIGLLAGEPIKEINTELISNIYKHTKGKLPIIACGGVFTGQDAFEKISAGASLIQLYSAIIYQGPNVVNKINKELLSILQEKGFSSVTQAIGSAVQMDEDD